MAGASADARHYAFRDRSGSLSVGVDITRLTAYTASGTSVVPQVVCSASLTSPYEPMFNIVIRPGPAVLVHASRQVQ